MHGKGLGVVAVVKVGDAGCSGAGAEVRAGRVAERALGPPADALCEREGAMTADGVREAPVARGLATMVP